MGFKINDRVILAQLKDITPSPQMPLWGSGYSCVGTVVCRTPVWITVEWDNGTESMFFAWRLRYHDGDKASLNPNVAFSMRKKRNAR